MEFRGGGLYSTPPLFAPMEIRRVNENIRNYFDTYIRTVYYMQNIFFELEDCSHFKINNRQVVLSLYVYRYI